MLRPSACTTLPVPGDTSFVSATLMSLDMILSSCVFDLKHNRVSRHAAARAQLHPILQLVLHFDLNLFPRNGKHLDRTQVRSGMAGQPVTVRQTGERAGELHDVTLEALRRHGP